MAPNVLLVVADDIPRNMLATYGATHRLSPAIDSLSRTGLVLDQAYTPAPLCTPARFSLLTGRYAANASSIRAKYPWNLVGFNTFLTGEAETMAHRLREVGYLTVLVGKYHLGFPSRLHSAGKQRTAFNGNGAELSYDELLAAVRNNSGFETVEALWGANWQMAQVPHHPEYMAERATASMRKASATGRPWFVYFAGTVPHQPFSLPDALLANLSLTPNGLVTPDPSWAKKRASLLEHLRQLGLVCQDEEDCRRSVNHSEADTRHNPAYEEPLAARDAPWIDPSWLQSPKASQQARFARLFLSGLSWFDTAVATLLDEIEALKATASTMVVYTADHGATFLGKGAPYEAGVRVPLLIRWPDGLKDCHTGSERDGARFTQGSQTPGDPRSVSDVGRATCRYRGRVSLLDIFPTVLSAAGARNDGSHGINLLPIFTRGRRVMTSKSDGLGTRALFFEVGYARAVLHGEWKLIVVHHPSDECRQREALQGARSTDAWEPLVDAKSPACRSFHGTPINILKCNFSGPSQVERGRLPGTCDMVYDAPSRHPHFCDRRQLYHLLTDPTEQVNVVDEHPTVYQTLLSALLEHVAMVEEGNPAAQRLVRNSGRTNQSGYQRPCNAMSATHRWVGPQHI